MYSTKNKLETSRFFSTAVPQKQNFLTPRDKMIQKCNLNKVPQTRKFRVSDPIQKILFV